MHYFSIVQTKQCCNVMMILRCVCKSCLKSNNAEHKTQKHYDKDLTMTPLLESFTVCTVARAVSWAPELPLSKRWWSLNHTHTHTHTHKPRKHTERLLKQLTVSCRVHAFLCSSNATLRPQNGTPFNLRRKKRRFWRRSSSGL